MLVIQQFASFPVWSEWIDGERHLIGGYPDVEMRDQFMDELVVASR